MNGGSRRLAVAFAVIAVAMLLVSGCTGSGAPGGGGTTRDTGTGVTTGSITVVEKDFRFSPATVAVPVGGKVVFENQDSAEHHIVVGTVDLGVQPPGKSVSWPADEAGDYAIKCLIHPSMIGQVTVGTGGGGSSAPPPPSGTTSAPAGGSGGYGY